MSHQVLFNNFQSQQDSSTNLQQTHNSNSQQFQPSAPGTIDQYYDKYQQNSNDYTNNNYQNHDYQTAKFISNQLSHQDLTQRIDDIIFHDNAMQNPTLRPSSSKSGFRTKAAFQNKNIAAVTVRPKSAIVGQKGNQQPYVYQKAKTKGVYKFNSNEILSHIQKMAKNNLPSMMGYSESVKSILSQSRRSHPKLQQLKSDLFNFNHRAQMERNIQQQNIQFGSKCPLPLHKQNSSKMKTPQPKHDNLSEKKIGHNSTFLSSRSIKSSKNVRPQTAKANLKSSNMITKMLTEHRILEEFGGTSPLVIQQSQQGSKMQSNSGLLSKRNISSSVIKYRNNDYDNFQNQTAKQLLGKVEVLKPRLLHSKKKYMATLKGIQYFEKATKQHYEMLQNHQSQYRPNQINLIGNSQKNVDAVLKANAREDPFSLAHQALRVVQSKYYKNSNKPLGNKNFLKRVAGGKENEVVEESQTVDYFTKKDQSEIKMVVDFQRKKQLDSKPSLYSSRLLKSFSSRSLSRPQTADIQSRPASRQFSHQVVEIASPQDQVKDQPSMYDQNDPDIMQVKQLTGQTDLKFYKNTDQQEKGDNEFEQFIFQPELQCYSEIRTQPVMQTQLGKRKSNRPKTAKGTTISSDGKRLKLKLNITPRFVMESDPKNLVMVGKNVNPQALKQLNEAQLRQRFLTQTTTYKSNASTYVTKAVMSRQQYQSPQKKNQSNTNLSKNQQILLMSAAQTQTAGADQVSVDQLGSIQMQSKVNRIIDVSQRIDTLNSQEKKMKKAATTKNLKFSCTKSLKKVTSDRNVRAFRNTHGGFPKKVGSIPSKAGGIQMFTSLSQKDKSEIERVESGDSFDVNGKKVVFHPSQKSSIVQQKYQRSFSSKNKDNNNSGRKEQFSSKDKAYETVSSQNTVFIPQIKKQNSVDRQLNKKNKGKKEISSQYVSNQHTQKVQIDSQLISKNNVLPIDSQDLIKLSEESTQKSKIIKNQIYQKLRTSGNAMIQQVEYYEGRNTQKISSPSSSQIKASRRVLLVKDPHHKSGIRTPLDENQN